MRRAGQNVALLAAGAALLWITLAGHEYLNYVRPGFRLLVVAAGAVLCALGGAGLVKDWRQHTEASSGDGHDHGRGPRATWLMRIAISGVPAPAADSWVQVTGTWSPTWAKIHDVDTPRFTATSVRRIGKPSDPYE